MVIKKMYELISYMIVKNNFFAVLFRCVQKIS